MFSDGIDPAIKEPEGKPVPEIWKQFKRCEIAVECLEKRACELHERLMPVLARTNPDAAPGCLGVAPKTEMGERLESITTQVLRIERLILDINARLEI